MKINSILKKLNIPRLKYNHDVFKITDDDRECYINSVFFAIKGHHINGYDKINDAIKNGAKTIVLSDEIKEIDGINYLYSDNVGRLLALFLKVYYEKYLLKTNIIGVIGTNGKTTTSTLIYKFLRYININAMLIGSNGAFLNENYYSHNNTTPKITDIYKYIINAIDNNCKYIIMELSSIGISELRVLGIEYKYLIFTNFSEDHLDYHINMDSYLFNKCIPFYKLNKNSYAIINIDSEESKSIIKHLECGYISYSIKNNSLYQAKNIIVNKDGIIFSCNNNLYKSNLLATFNIYNILPLIIIADILKINQEYVYDFLLLFNNVLGRMNYYNFNNYNIIIDYAHTPDAIKNVLIEVKKFCNNNIYVCVGCGGNRDKEKRRVIGSILSSFECSPIITTDNPRFEDPKEIINDILSGANKKLMVIEDRRKAIFYALNNMEPDDYLLILGKGKEEYIDRLGKKEKYSDLAVVKEWFNI